MAQLAAAARRHPAPAVGVITLVALVLRLWGLGDKSLWIDESFSHWISAQPLDAVWRYTVQLDQHPPLYYTLLHLWIGGQQAAEAQLRGFSVLCGVATVPLVYLIGRDAGGRRLGLLAATLQAVSPLHVWYAQQARMYTMMTLFATAATCCLVRLLTSRRALGPAAAACCWAGFSVALALTMLSHNTGVLFPVAIAVLVAAMALVRARSTTVPATVPTVRLPAPGAGGDDTVVLARPAPVGPRAVAAATAAGLVLWSPWLPGFLLQSGRVDAEFWLPAPTVGKVAEHLRDLGSARAPGTLLVPLVLGFLALAGLGAWRLRRRPAVVALLAALLLVPMLGELAVSVRRPIFYSQTLIWTSVPLAVLLAAGAQALPGLRPRRQVSGTTRPGRVSGTTRPGRAAGELVAAAGPARGHGPPRPAAPVNDPPPGPRWPAWASGRRVAAAVVATLLLLNTFSLATYYRDPGQEDWRAAAGYVATFAEPGDVVLFDAGWAQLPFDYYYRGPRVSEHGLPAEMFERGVLEPKMAAADLARLDELTEGRSRVWVVYSHDWYTDPQALVANRLESAMDPVARREFRAVRVVTYVPH